MQGVDTKAKCLMDENVMHQAAGQARLNVLKALLAFPDAGLANLVAHQNAVGDTPLHCAASIGSASCVRCLLEHSSELLTHAFTSMYDTR